MGDSSPDFRPRVTLNIGHLGQQKTPQVIHMELVDRTLNLWDAYLLVG